MTRCKHHPISVAPMMQRTDRHYRVMMRAITGRALLYTEMVTTGAVLHGDKPHLLGFSEVEHPIALQLGGDDPEALAECARIGEGFGYDEINLNVGCPSERVQKGSFGVSLMGRPDVVAAAVEKMRAAVSVPVTVKHRIGFDDLDRYEDMANFVRMVSEAGCDRFSVHARKAWLKGLSPRDNRNIPPLRYEDVHRLKADFPALLIEINGGIRALDDAEQHLHGLDGVMIGRAAYDNPWLFADVDRRFYGAQGPSSTRAEAVAALLPYIEEQVALGVRLHAVTRHMHMLFAGQPGGKAWRRHLSVHGIPMEARADVVADALAVVERIAADVAARADMLAS